MPCKRLRQRSAKEEAQVIHSQLAQCFGVLANGALKHELLLLLQLEDTLLDRAGHNEARHTDGLVLAQPVDAVLQSRAVAARALRVLRVLDLASHAGSPPPDSSQAQQI